MLGLPPNTEVNHFISKNKIYTKFELNNAQKARFDEDIKKITVVNEVSAQTVKIADGGGLAGLFERPNKKTEEGRAAESGRDELLKTIDTRNSAARRYSIPTFAMRWTTYGTSVCGGASSITTRSAFISRWITPYLMKCINASSTIHWKRLHEAIHLKLPQKLY